LPPDECTSFEVEAKVGIETKRGRQKARQTTTSRKKKKKMEKNMDSNAHC